MFRTLTEEKATATRDIDKGKNCWNFAQLEENVLAPVSLEGKSEEHSMCVSDCIDSDRDWFTMKGVHSQCTNAASYGSDIGSYGSYMVIYGSSG